MHLTCEQTWHEEHHAANPLDQSARQAPATTTSVFLGIPVRTQDNHPAGAGAGGRVV